MSRISSYSGSLATIKIYIVVIKSLFISRGKFGEVKQCKEHKTGRDFAAKFIDVQGPQDMFDVKNEIEVMKNLQHPRLLQLYDVFQKKNHFALVLEL